PGYEILEVLGMGGMGVVYKARQLSLNRIVALKTIRGEGPGAARWRRLREEAELVASLNHANVVQIFDLGEFAGQVFIAMEYVTGATLPRLRPWERLPPTHAAALAELLADALGFIHRRGLVHRDVKPSNVLLAAPGASRPRAGRDRAVDRYGLPKLT